MLVAVGNGHLVPSRICWISAKDLYVGCEVIQFLERAAHLGIIGMSLDISVELSCGE